MEHYSVKISESGRIAVDDTILVKDYPCAAGSKILDGFIPLFSAEAVCRLEKAGYVISGKTATGEFGLDLTGEFSVNGAVVNGEGHITSAAADLVAKGEVDAALCVDLNGAPARAAAFSDVAFVKPTYGTVSRYGVIPCACSGEQIGVCAASIDKAAEILGVIAGHDDKDGTSLPPKKYEYKTDLPVNGMRVCVLGFKGRKQTAAVKDFIARLPESVSVGEAEFSLAEEARNAWQILMSAETCNNISRYDGVKFGHRTADYKNIDELYVNSRTEGMNLLTKENILYGSYVLSKDRYVACYDKALRVRRLVREEFDSLFEKYDVVVMPSVSGVYGEYDIKDAFRTVFEESIYTAPASITGLPAVDIGGVRLMGDARMDNALLSLAKYAEGAK